MTSYGLAIVVECLVTTVIVVSDIVTIYTQMASML